VQSQISQNVAVRIDLAFKAFFRRVKAGETPAYSHFRGHNRHDGFTIPHMPVGRELDAEAKRLRVMNVGLVKIVVHRPLEGTPKTATISWSSTDKGMPVSPVSVPSPLPKADAVVDSDVGLKTFAMLSTGAGIANPRFFCAEEKALSNARLRGSKDEKGRRTMWQLARW
jgi:putative transposase